MKKYLIGGAVLLAAILCFLWPGWIWSPFGGDEKAKTGEVTDTCEAELGACTDQLATCDPTKGSEAQVMKATDDCKKTLDECKVALGACENEKAELAKEDKKKVVKKDDGKKKIKKEEKKEGKAKKDEKVVKEEKPVISGKIPAEADKIDTTPRIAGPADVEVKDGKIYVKSKKDDVKFVKVIFYGSYGVCQEVLKYRDLENDSVDIPDLSSECRWFNVVDSNEKWANVGASTQIKGGCIVKETNGSFADAYAYALPDSPDCKRTVEK